ncbi:transcription factor bHLH167-like [Cornus florida]|uniref:transcription factor bHLH167-like n=1 Tax=Cornus florida TaxID=4283 RepID=UPI00289F7AC2|nr:transcription factor bHLH167-like [Cornus florida]
MQPGSSSLKTGRNEVVKNRRRKMNHLISILYSLIFTQRSQERVALPVLLDKAGDHIKGLKESIEQLQRRKEQLKLPILAVEEMGSTLEVKLITRLNKNFMLHQLLTVLEEENVEVVSANYSNMGDKIIYTIHSQVFRRGSDQPVSGNSRVSYMPPPYALIDLLASTSTLATSSKIHNSN